jgi:hypothetical protein
MQSINQRRSALFMAAFVTMGSVGATQAKADINLFTTQDDFAGWSGGGFSVSPTSTDLDGSSINGAANANPGSPGTPGGLSLTWQSGTFDYIFSGGLSARPSFLSALGSSGTIYIDYTTPPPGTGNYFQLGLVLNYSNAFDQTFGGAAVSLGNGVSEQAINYTLSHPAASYGYFQLGLIYNSNYNTNTPFTVDNIHVPGTPPPPLGHDAATWTHNGSANWIDAANWTPDIPGGGAGASATFGTNGGSINTASQIVVTLTSPVAVDSITFDKGGGGYKIAGASAIALNAIPTAGVIVNSGNHEIAAPLAMSGNNNTFTVATGASLTVDNLSGGGFGQVTVNGGGTFSTSAIQNVSLIADASTVNFLPGNAQANGFIYGITLANGAIVNLNDANVKNNTLSSGGTPGSIRLGAGGVLTTGEFGSYTFSGAITGLGRVVVGGDNANQDSVVGFAGNNSYSGTTTLTNGSIVDVFAASSLGDGSPTNSLILDQGTLRAGAGFTSARQVIVNPGSGTIDTNGFNITLGGVSGNGSLNKQGDGQLTVSNVQTRQQLNVSQGSVLIAANGGSGGAVILNSLSVGNNNVDTNSKLDLNDNDLILTNGGDTNSIRSLLIAGYNGGNWNGNGLASLAAANHPAAHTALGYGLSGDVGITSLDGVDITDGNTVIVKYTYNGDSSLDGKVDLGNDFNLFLQGFLTGGSNWESGDYNYDGVVDVADFKMYIDGYKSQGGALGDLDNAIAATPFLTISEKASFLSMVPEPSSMALVAFAAALAGRRRLRGRIFSGDARKQ